MAGQIWGTANLGGYLSAKNLSKVMRMQVQKMCKFRQLCDVSEALGKRKGQYFTWDVFSDIATGGAALTETSAMPESNFTITQAQLTVTEYGNSIPWTGKLQDLSEFEVNNIVKKVLKNDCRNTLDTAAYNQFDLTPLRVAPTAGTSTNSIVLSTGGSTAITNNVALGKDHIKAIVDTMEERNIPGYFDTDDYVAVGRPTTFRPFKNELETIHQYTDEGFGMILNGEIGRYEGIRFVTQTNIASEGWTNAKSDGVFFCGEDTVVEAIVVPEEVRGKIPDDYGRSHGMAWYYLGGFGLVHTSATNARIVKWDSAA